MPDDAPLAAADESATNAPPLKYDRSTGKAVMADPSGEIYTIDPTKVADAAQAGWRPASEAEYESAKEGAEGTVRAAVEGAARTVIPVNVFDPLAVEASRLAYGERGAELARQQLREDEQMHPTATFAGEIGGSLLPLMFGAPPGGSAAVAGEGFLARAGSRILSAAPRAFGEGALIGLGQQVHEDVLGDHDLAAQKYLAAGLKGGILGVIAGGGLHAGFGAIGDKLALRGEAAAERALTRTEGSVYRTAASGGAELAEKGAEREGNVFTRMAEEQAAKGAMPSASLAGSELQKLGATAEEQQERLRRVGRTLLDEGVSTTTATKSVQAERLAERVAKRGAELGEIRKTFETAAARPSAENIVNRIESEVIAPLVERPFTGAQVDAIKPTVRELVERLGGVIEKEGTPEARVVLESPVVDSFETLHNLRRELDKQLKWDKGIPPPSPALKELRAIRGILEDEYEKAAEKAAAELGEDLADRYRATKAIYSDLKTAQKWATKAAARETQNRAISLTDTIMAGAALASGHPLAMLAPLGNKIVRTFGNQAAAQMLDRVGRIETIARAAQTFDEKLNGSVASFFGKGKPPPPTTTRAATKASPELVRELRTALQNPAALTERVADHLAGTDLKEHAPEVARGMATTIMRAATYVRGQLPPEPMPTGVSWQPQKPRPYGAKAQARIDNALSALDADAFLDDFARGRVDRQKVEAIKIISPPLFDAMKQKIRDYSREEQPGLTQQRAIALSIIFDEPVSAVMQPAKISGFQQAYAKDVSPDPQTAAIQRKPMGNGAGQSRTAQTMRSTTDRIEAGDA